MGGLAVAAHEDLEGHHHGRQQRGATGQAVCAPGHRGDEAKGKFVDSIMFSIIQLDDKKHIKIHLKNTLQMVANRNTVKWYCNLWNPKGDDSKETPQKMFLGSSIFQKKWVITLSGNSLQMVHGQTTLQPRCPRSQASTVTYPPGPPGVPRGAGKASCCLEAFWPCSVPQLCHLIQNLT